MSLNSLYMKQVWHITLKVLRIAIGSICLLVGIIGLAAPILPGWAFIIPGVVILAKDIPVFRRLMQWVDQKIIGWVERRFPRVREPFRKLREKLRHHHDKPAEPAPAAKCEPQAKTERYRSAN